MREEQFSLYAWLSVVVISLPIVCCSSGWKPIAPPEEYYATTPKTSVRDCEPGCKYPFLDDAGGGQQAETQVKSTLLSPPIAFNQEKSFHQSNKKVDLKIFKPTEVSYFPSGDGKALDSSLTYQEVFRQSPSSFYSYKSYGGAGKPTKTIYYGDLELAKPKYDVKYYKPFKQSYKTELKLYKPGNFHDNDVNFYQSPKQNPLNDHCTLYKVSLRQDLYYQYIQYKVHMPELKEFTLCLWMRFHNHSHDHSLFSYGAKTHRQAIYMWVSNLNEPALFNMKVLGQTIFRLNYPIKLYKWYHTCQSWNGHTGEWQVWVNSHRIGRGFHNLLVNHPVPGGGVAISGQEHRHFGKGYQEIPQYFKGSGGLAGEITMLQLYKVALTAGKAYNDHSHHHSHYTSTTPEPPELPTDEPSTTTDHPLLENGQLKKHVNVLELAEALKKGQLDTPEHHQPSYSQFFDVPLANPYVSHVAPLTVHGNTISFVGLPGHAVFKRNDESKAIETKSDTQVDARIEGAEKKTDEKRIKFLSNVSDQVQVEKIRFIGNSDDAKVEEPMTALPHKVEERSTNITDDASEESDIETYSEEESGEENTSGVRVGKRLRRHNPSRVAGERTRITIGHLRPSRYFTYGGKMRGNGGKSTPRKANEGMEASKRRIFEDSYLNFGTVGLTSAGVYPGYGGAAPTGISYDHFLHFGQDFPDLHGGGEQNGEDSHLDYDDSDKKKKKEVELAEGEVMRIMGLCSGCHVDPFRKVAVISWRSTPKKIFSGGLFLKAKTECENF